MQLLTPPSATLPETLISALQPPTSTIQRPQLSMVWHKEWDGKRERMVARWMMD